MAKKILVKFSDAKTYAIPAEFVANARAKYYADKDVLKSGGVFAEIFQQEFEFTMKDDEELLDWLENNVNWEDVKEIAELYNVEYFPANYDDEFGSAYKEIISE
jgi:hypothetical protein